jgi:hypothetical protein
MHNIAMHEDGTDSDGNSYVRMTGEERSKLDNISINANRLVFEVEDAIPSLGNVVTIDEGPVRFVNSSTVFFDFTSPNFIKAHSVYPPDVAHRHHYDFRPAYADDPSMPSFKLFKTTSLNTPYMEGSLRVYVNGLRLTTDTSTFNYIMHQNHLDGTFELNRALSIDDVIRIDFDENFYTISPTQYPTPTPTRTPTPSPTPTHSPTPSHSPSPTPSHSHTPSATPTRTPTRTPSPTHTSTRTPTPTRT